MTLLTLRRGDWRSWSQIGFPTLGLSVVVVAEDAWVPTSTPVRNRPSPKYNQKAEQYRSIHLMRQPLITMRCQDLCH